MVRPKAVPINVASVLPCLAATPAAVNVNVAVAFSSVFSGRRGRLEVGAVAPRPALLGSA